MNVLFYSDFILKSNFWVLYGIVHSHMKCRMNFKDTTLPKCLTNCFLISGSVDSENESEEVKPAKETINFKEVKRVDHILASLQRKVTFFNITNHLLSIDIICMSFIFTITESYV